MKFWVGLAAAVWTLRNVGPVGWVLIGLTASMAALAVLTLWPFLVVGAIAWGIWWLVVRHHYSRKVSA